MMPGLVSSLSFTAPWLLTGAVALPVIWWLLRLTPPRAESVSFPPTSILLGLREREKTPVRSPWWLTLLRMAIAAAVILALAGPSLKSSEGAFAQAEAHPFLVVVDNGWASASRWAARVALADQLAALAEDEKETLILAPTAGAVSSLQALTPAEFRQRFASLQPQAYPGERAALAERINAEFPSKDHLFRVVWLADGVDDAGSVALGDALKRIAADGTIDVYGDPAASGALALAQLSSTSAGPIRARVFKGEPAARTGIVAAITTRGDRLAAAPFDIPSASSFADVSLDLPLELRNQVTRLEIAGEASAGSVYLIDERSQRRRVGLVVGEGTDDAQPLLSSTYYLERALSPFAEVTKARTVNLDQATAELINGSPSIIILSDVGRLSGDVADRLATFVKKGGMLIRFAGPRLEQGGDGLLPTPLREGGRTLGGAMTWTSPQTPAPFEQGSPFEGLSVPKDVTISRQVLADPASMPRETAVWARLTDGTPLVTATRLGAGTLVFFHITANPDWSNLPISGLFVEMMRKTLGMAPLQVSKSANAKAETKPAPVNAGQDAALRPWRVLDGFGKLSVPGERVQAVAAGKVDGMRANSANPAGLYGPQNALRAINVASEADKLVALKTPQEAHVFLFSAATTTALAPWLFLIALGLFLVDGIICALLLGRGPARLPKKAVAMLALGLVFASAGQGRAETKAAASDATAFALQASLETHLAYVLTGNAEADRVSYAGLSGLSKILTARTAVEPGEPMAVDPARDELVFFPLIYWPVLPNATPLPDAVLAKIDAYMKQGGLIIFDTKNDESSSAALLSSGVSTPLSQLLGKLDLPPLQRVPDDHVLTKSFYLLQSFPGRWDNGDPWVEARSGTGADAAKRAVKADGVSSVIVTSNDMAAAWALDDNDRPMFAVVPGGENQREMSYRVGVNIVMYALTGNYKADQVHVPAILERLGH